MGETISIGDSLTITLFSIIMVFLALVVISIFISMLKNLDRKKQEPTKTKDTKSGKVDIIKDKEAKEPQIAEEANDEELIAVISAAVAASLGLSVPQINIKSIKRINDSSPAWSTAGRQEQINNNL